MKIRPRLKAQLIDDVTEAGESLTAKQIVDRVNIRKADELHGIVLEARSLGGIFSMHLTNKFRQERRPGESSLWVKVTS